MTRGIEVPRACPFFLLRVCLTVGLIGNLSDYGDGVLLPARISVFYKKKSIILMGATPTSHALYNCGQTAYTLTSVVWSEQQFLWISLLSCVGNTHTYLGICLACIQTWFWGRKKENLKCMWCDIICGNLVLVAF